MLAVAPLRKLVPLIVISLPPLLVPETGLIELIVGAALVNRYPLVNVATWLSGLVTTTSTAPAAWAGVVAAGQDECNRRRC